MDVPFVYLNICLFWCNTNVCCNNCGFKVNISLSIISLVVLWYSTYYYFLYVAKNMFPSFCNLYTSMSIPTIHYGLLFPVPFGSLYTRCLYILYRHTIKYGLLFPAPFCSVYTSMSIHTIHHGLIFHMIIFPPFGTYIDGRYKLANKDSVVRE